MIQKLRVVTTHGTYTSTTPEADAGAQEGYTLADELAGVLGGTGARRVIVKADGIGWLALNAAHVVAIEVHEADGEGGS